MMTAAKISAPERHPGGQRKEPEEVKAPAGYAPTIVRRLIDHFIPLSRGGQNTRANRVLSCYPCNLAKDDTDPRETNQWPHVEQRLAEIAATPLISHRRLKEILPELVKEVYA